MDNADPELCAAGKVLRRKPRMVILYPCQTLSLGCCSLKTVVSKDILVCL